LYFFFDTETTGLPLDWKAPVDDFENWPRLVQIAWLVYDDEVKLIEKVSEIILPEGYRIPDEAAAVHGISTDRAYEEGVPLDDVLVKFIDSTKQCRDIVAHNMAFDEKIIKCELLRKSMEDPLHDKKMVCTMLASINLCKIPRMNGYKWPKLIELHHKLFGEGFEDEHDALADIEACARCFWKLRELHYL
jgi:DNA polymerase III subunit epsilon